jgi:hypothetical protein
MIKNVQHYLISCAFLILMLCIETNAATWYVDGSLPNDSGDGTSWGTAKRYINSGIGLMGGGDTLYIRDGVYTGSNNKVSGSSIPNGTSGNYTEIYAEHDYGVTITGITGNSFNTTSSYVEVRGIKVTNNSEPHFYIEGSHNKVIRCASDGPGSGNPSFLAEGQYILFEECHSWGGGRYPFMVYSPGRYVIFRRCVVRWDYSNT